ncbi:hypothetical protein V2J09_009317 [Rumex salicifolius]
MIGAMLGLGTKLYSNALRKLPYMRHPWEHVIGMRIGVVFVNQLVKWDAKLQVDLDKMLEKAKAANERRYIGGRIHRALCCIISSEPSFPPTIRNCLIHHPIAHCSSNFPIKFSTSSQFSQERVMFNAVELKLFFCGYDVRLCGNGVKWLDTRGIHFSSVEMKEEDDVIRFRVQHSPGDSTAEKELLLREGKKAEKRKIASRKAKLKELRFYRLKAKKKLKSPNPEVRIKYKLEKAKRKEVWLIEKLRKFELPKAAQETHDPEILTEEDRFYLRRTGDRKKHYVPVGRRGVFGGVVLNMHLHWKRHETVKVVCRPCKPGQIHEIAEELARLSSGIAIDIKPNNTIIFYRGKNYVQPDVMSPPNTLSKNKALEKYKYEQSLEHTSQFIERLEKELEEYQEHFARFNKAKENVPDSRKTSILVSTFQ